MAWNDRREWPLLALIGLAFAIALVAWPSSPAQVPTHWNLAGQVDGWAPKAVGLLIAPVVAAIVYVLLMIAPRLDPLGANYARFAGAYTATRALVLVVIVAVQAMIAATALGREVRVEWVMPLAVGIMFIGLGFLLPRFEPNWFAGIRTPWTLSSEEVWHRTHHVGGPVFMVLGVLVSAASFLGGSTAFGVIAGAAAVASLGLVVYSYVVWRQLQARP